MYYTTYSFLLYLHILVGSVSLITFWLPVIAKKGSAFHIKAGKWFEYGMLTVAGTGIIITLMVLIDPLAVKDPQMALSSYQVAVVSDRSRLFAWFLLMLSLLVLNTTRHSILVLKCKNDRQPLRKLPHLLPIIMMALISPYVAYLGITSQFVLLQIFAALCLVNSYRLLSYIFKKELKAREWLIEHLTNIIGAGIGAYTAFFAFGGRRLLEGFIAEQWQIMFWVLPGVIGGICVNRLAKKYRLQYRVN